MAFLKKPSLTDQDKTNSSGTSSLVNTESSSIQAVGSGNGTPSSGKTSGNYTDLNTYLKANEGSINDFADKITGDLNSKAQSFENKLSDANNRFNTSVDQNTFKQDKSWVDNVFKDPTAFTKNKDEVNQFHRIRDNKYDGFKSLSDVLNPLDARKDINYLDDRASLFGNSTGREQILRENQKGGLYNPGLSKLDNALIQGSDSARNKFVNTGSTILGNNYTGQLSKSELDADNLYKTTAQANKNLSDDTRSRFNPAFQKEKDTLQGYANKVNKNSNIENDMYNANYMKSNRIWAPTGGNDVNGNPNGYYVDIPNTQNPYNMDDSIGDSNFLNKIHNDLGVSGRDFGILRNRESANMNTVSNADDLAKMEALNELGGSEFEQKYLDPNAYRSASLRAFGDGTNPNLRSQLMELDQRRRLNLG